MDLQLERLQRVLADRYQLERELGRGGMATVYLAQDLKHHRDVAIKVLRHELGLVIGRERFLREIEIAARLRHPHILPVYDSGEADGFLYYVMPYVEGDSLRATLKREKQLPLDEALQIAREVADALSYAHSHDVVHRDIKPENVLLESGHAVVADFGIARAITSADAERLTETGLVIGTPAYMSPEQATGDRVDGRSDLYSLGCVLFEMLTGDPPFTGSSGRAILARKAVDHVPSVRSVRRTVPNGVERALERALATVPADRFPTVQAFVAALTAPGIATRRRRLWPVATLATLVVFGIAVFWRLDSNTAGPRLDRLGVLPFTNLTGDVNQQHFVDAMHDAVITELGKIGALTVISRQSMLRYRATEQSLSEIARELNVDALVQGSVFRGGDTVRISAQLIQLLPTERQLWSQTYQGDLSSVLALHGEVARGVAQRIEVALTPAEIGRFGQARTVNRAAHAAWVQGRAHSELGDGPSMERCIQNANKAAAIDSGFAQAYSLAAGCYLFLAFVTPTAPRDAFDSAKTAARRAIAIDPSLGEAHAWLGGALSMGEWDWSGADNAFEQAIKFAPGSAFAHWLYGFYLAWIGRNGEASEHSLRAEELSPVNPMVSSNVAMVLYLARNYNDAITQARLVVKLHPNFAFGYDRLAHVLEAQGQIDEAIAAWEQAAAHSVGDLRRRAYLGRAYGLGGRQREAMRIRSELLQLQETTYVPPTAIAMVHLGLGQLDEAIVWLEKGFEDRDAEMVLLKTWPVLDPLRSKPRFQLLLRRMAFP